MKPKIVDPQLSFTGSLTVIRPSEVKKLVQHHMAQPTWDVYDVHQYHTNGNGWYGIGYNWWIAFDGTIYEGRGWHVGAHCRGYNETTLGIGYQGDFTKQQMTNAQLKAGIALNNWLISQLPGVSVRDIVGHKDLVRTICPGDHFRMKELKDSISAPTAVSKQPADIPSVTPATTTSIVDYLKSINVDASFRHRKQLAQYHGVRNYRGTAAQNIELLNKIRNGRTAVYHKGDMQTPSVVDYLKSINQDSSFPHRQQLAKAFGITNYQGTAAQNQQLLKQLRGR